MVTYDIVMSELEGRPANYSWLAEWLGEENLADNLENLLFRNIYLNRVNLEKTDITDRMIQDTKKSRNILYQEAAELLEFYQKEIENENWKNNIQEIVEMLNNTFILPEKESVLFELYWTIKILKANAKDYHMELIDGESSTTAHWQKEGKNYKLYHDCGRTNYLSWQVNLDELDSAKSEYLIRRVDGRKKAKELTQVFSSAIESKMWSGRPDIILEVTDKKTGKLEKVIIGEVKFTKNEETAKNGMKELMDYIQLVKKDNKYINDFDEVNIIGLLLVDSIELENGKNMRAMKIKKRNYGRWTANRVYNRKIKV